jgi:hypothetical protein
MTWFPASQPVRQGDFRFRIVSAVVKQPEIRNIFSSEISLWKVPVLMIKVRIENLGKIDGGLYRIGVPRIVDNLGNHYREINLGTSSLVERSLGDRQLYAGKALEDILLFDNGPTGG